MKEKLFVKLKEVSIHPKTKVIGYPAEKIMKPSEFLYKEDGRYLLSVQTLKKLDNNFIDKKESEENFGRLLKLIGEWLYVSSINDCIKRMGFKDVRNK